VAGNQLGPGCLEVLANAPAFSRLTVLEVSAGDVPGIAPIFRLPSLPWLKIVETRR
jgi:hypothetical protein